jgi:transposase
VTRPDASTTVPRRRGASLADLRAGFEPLLAAGRAEDACEFLLAAYAAVFAKNEELALLVARLRRPGRRSERVDPEHLQLLFDQMLTGEDPAVVVNQLDEELSSELDAVLEREIAVAEAAVEARAADAAPGRRSLRAARAWQTAETVPHEVHICEVPAEARRCGTCGAEQRAIGHDLAHRLEFVPAHFIEHEYHVAKYACPRCKEGVTTAPGPVRVLERSAADASLFADIVVSKYVDHCPLHRLHRIYDRTGVGLPVSTMADWVAGVAELVAPLVDRIAQRVQDAYVVRTDATGLKVLDPASPAHIELGTLWCYVGDDRDVLFRYAPTGEGTTGPWAFLAGRRGYIQADAASVFDRLFTGRVATAVEVGCLAHARRRYVALKDTDARVAYPLKQIARVYRIEHLADVEGCSPEARARLRQARSLPLLEKLHRWALAVAASEEPASELAKAARYTVNHWTALTRFVTDGRLAPDNNLCEQQLRAIALGRKNYLFSGSHAAAVRAATLYSLMRTCAQYQVAPLPYLTDVLQRLAHGVSAGQLDAVLPDRWQAAQANAT